MIVEFIEFTASFQNIMHDSKASRLHKTMIIGIVIMLALNVLHPMYKEVMKISS